MTVLQILLRVLGWFLLCGGIFGGTYAIVTWIERDRRCKIAREHYVSQYIPIDELIDKNAPVQSRQIIGYDSTTKSATVREMDV